jgi:hypothetical protein
MTTKEKTKKRGRRKTKQSKQKQVACCLRSLCQRRSSRCPIPCTHISIPDLVALQHAVHKIAQRPPVVSSTRQVVLVNEEHVLLKARVEVRLQAELTDHGVVMAVDVCVHTVHALEDLANQGGEGLGEWYAC